LVHKYSKQIYYILLILFSSALLSQTEKLEDPPKADPPKTEKITDKKAVKEEEKKTDKKAVKGEEKKTDKKAAKGEEKKPENRPAVNQQPAKKKEVKKPLPKKKERLIYIDFRDKPITDFLKAMTKVIKRNILVDESIKGKITIISNKGIPESKVYPFFKSVLESKGFAVIEEKQLIKIVPIKEAVAKGRRIHVGRKYISDQAISLDRIHTQVIPIFWAEAQQISSILKSISTKATTVLVYARTNTLVITGSGPEINTMIQVVKELDKPEADDDGCFPGDLGYPNCPKVTGGNVHIYRVVHHKAEKLAQVLVKLDNPEIAIAEAAAKETKKKKKGKKPRRKSSKRPAKNKRAQKIKAVAHKETNSLIITATPGEFKEILGIIKQLDIVRKQVLLEVLIAEVSADSNNSFGIDWSFNPERTRFPGAGLQNNNGLFRDSGIVNPDTQDFTGLNTLMGFSFGFINDSSAELAGLVNLNLNNDNFSILSSPQIMTLENEEAEINVGADIPVITGSRTSGASDATIQTFEYRPIGIKLKFTPYINANNSLTIDLYQEVKEVAGDTGTTDANPRFTKRDVKTFVTVENEKTIVIAGLISTNRNNIVRKIPILGDIPILGYLFKRESESTKKTNLLVFITPHILSDVKKQKKILDEKRQEQIRFYKENMVE